MGFLGRFQDKPFRLISVFGFIYLVITIVLNLITGFSYSDSVMPYSKSISLIVQSIALLLCILTFIFYTNHFLYYAGIEILILSNIYTGEIYKALFLSSILLVFLITEKRIVSKRNLIFYAFLELIKLLLVIPYGVALFLNYVGLTLFSLCTIGCMNLLFRHVYSRKDTSTLQLDDYKFSDRQKDCIKEIVMNNTTIKALAINHNVSESAIKKDLAHIYHELGITGKADLKALFIGFQF